MAEMPGAGGGAALGISVTDDQIASVVRGADGRVIASNLVDLPDVSAANVEPAIDELVASVPVHVDHIGIAVASDDVRTRLLHRFESPSAAPWYGQVSVTDHPSALAEVGRSGATRGGIVAVVDLDRDGAPAPGPSVVTVDSATGAVLGTRQILGGTYGPLTDAEAATRLAATVAAMPGGSALTSVIVTGPGAQTPGIAPAFEYATQRPVTIADQPALAAAVGAVDAVEVGSGAAAVGSTGKRWWFIGAAIGTAVVLGAIAITAVLAGERIADPVVSTTTVVSTPPPVTVAGDEVTETVTATRTATVTRTQSPVTRTSTETVTESADVPPATETETATETVTETATVTVTIASVPPLP